MFPTLLPGSVWSQVGAIRLSDLVHVYNIYLDLLSIWQVLYPRTTRSSFNHDANGPITATQRDHGARSAMLDGDDGYKKSRGMCRQGLELRGKLETVVHNNGAAAASSGSMHKYVHGTAHTILTTQPTTPAETSGYLVFKVVSVQTCCCCGAASFRLDWIIPIMNVQSCPHVYPSDQ